MLIGLQERLRRIFPSQERPAFSEATEEDVYYCYRLLLNREPDAPGWAYWTGLLEEHNLRLESLVDNFVNCEEFLKLQEERRRPRLVRLSQFAIYVQLSDHFIGAAIARSGQYEPHVARVLSSILEPGAVFVDVGANIGYFTLMAASLVGPEGQVHAFEPRRENCELLRQSVTENGFEQIWLYENAVAERAGVLDFGAAGGADSNGRLLTAEEVGEAHRAPRTVQAVTLDEALAGEERIDVIKMDIEGAEPRAWQGMQRIVERHRPVLLLEFAPDLIRMTSDVAPERFLDSLQVLYRLYVIESPEGMSKVAQTTAAILRLQQTSEHTHLDLLARPR